MIKIQVPVFLASQSPRRRKLLKLFNIRFKSFAVDLDEMVLDGEHPIATVRRLSSQKLELAKKKVSKGIIITADTIVVLNHKIINKPKSEKDAFRILKSLSGKTHTVYTGIAVYNSTNEKTIVTYEKTKVTFRTLDNKEIKDYISTGSPMDKAGAYGIQDDFGAVFVNKINGCYYNVVGLPLTKLYDSLKQVV